MARIRIWVREVTPSLSPTCERYCFTDPSESPMFLPIWRFVSAWVSH